MYAVVRPEITFKKDENIAVYEKEKYLTDISEEIYSLLMLFNGKMSDDDIKRLLAEVYVLDKRYAESIFETIRERFAYVLVFSEESNYEREFERLSDTCQYVDYRKIRYIVPKMLVISLTRNCFMKCRYCYADAKYSEKAEEKYTLDLNLIEKVVKKPPYYKLSILI